MKIANILRIDIPALEPDFWSSTVIHLLTKKINSNDILMAEILFPKEEII